MSQEVIVNGVTYRYPETGDAKWGDQATKWAVAVSNTTLQKIGGSFTLTNQLDFGSNSGIKTLRVSSQSPDQLETGFLSMGAGDTLSWSANAVTNTLTVSGNVLLYNGAAISGPTGITADQVAFTPNGSISSSNVQAAIDELDLATAKLTTATGSLITPSGTTAQRDASPVEGYIRRNTELSQWEGYDGNGWTGIGRVTTATGSFITPSGTTAQRDVSPVEGYIRRNTELSQWEGYDGNGWTGIGGASGGGGNPFCYENDQIVNVAYAITSGKNAMSAGPIEITDGITVTIPDGSTWSII